MPVVIVTLTTAQINRMDIHHRSVQWSPAKQLRSVIETSASVDDVFDFLIGEFRGVFDSDEGPESDVLSASHSHMRSKVKSTMDQQLLRYVYHRLEQDALATIQYRTLPVPWPLTSRDFFVVQDYIRVTGSNHEGTQTNWFFTYNHDLQHPYFAPRRGFVRAHVKYQGMVGVSAQRCRTRLTWLVNMDFGGFIPSSFMGALAVAVMGYPFHVVAESEKLVQGLSLSKRNRGIKSISKAEELDDETETVSLKACNRMREQFTSELEKLKGEIARKGTKIERLESLVSELRRRIVAERDSVGD